MGSRNTENEIYFNFSYFALRLLGKGLYSNVWTALAELVANSFDANAKNIKVYINAINKEKSIVEIFDDGYGMDYDALENKYTLIGKNKRDDNTLDEETKKVLMGRKGIGKLAALYLSNKYYLISKTVNEISAWCLDASNTNDSDIPKLSRKDVTDLSKNIETIREWDSFKTGTLIKLTNVDLTNFGIQSLKGLKARLANFFLLDSLAGKIEIAFRTKQEGNIVFEEVEKNIAFKNMCAFYNNTSYNYRKELGDTIVFNSNLDFVKNKKRSIVFFDESKFPDTNGSQCFIQKNGVKTENGIPFEMKGWIGIHSTIDKDGAYKNDKRYLKNKVYNPNKLRLYVRNKLAVDNFLEYIHNTQAFSNYIEGEISFDVLDDDTLPDIATSNRQGFDEESDRIKLLVDIIKPIVTALIRERVKFGNIINKEEKAYYEEQERLAREKELAAKKAQEEAEFARIQAESERDKANEAREQAEENLGIANEMLGAEKKRSTFLMENLSAEQLDFAKHFHLAKINLNTIKNKISMLVLKNKKNNLSIDDFWECIKSISYCAERISSIFSYILKAKFNIENEKIKENLFEFISDYCQSVLTKNYLLNFKIDNKASCKAVINFSPQDIGVIFDNIASNSKKAHAKEIHIVFDEDENFYIITIMDNGDGIDTKKITDVNALFEFGKGFTETGTGIGLYHIKEVVEKKLNGNVSIDTNYLHGFKLRIEVKK